MLSRLLFYVALPVVSLVVYRCPKTMFESNSIFLENLIVGLCSVVLIRDISSINELSYFLYPFDRGYRSIGKFCSNNAGNPFTMYSRDRIARISYYTDGYVIGKGFKFSYTLKGHDLGNLGSIPTSRTY